ncbi:MAG TPA: glycosyltransferase family A protein [Rhizomicrobium sp.]|jgi:glycosyltransferase involved in cell wall biosynthesis
MDNNPLVTVVIPTWNRERLVEQAVASVVAQSHANWELFVVDDGSTDDTVGRLERLALPNVRILRSAHLGHIGRLRNLGAATGRGEFIAFLDSDDLWRQRKLEIQLGAVRSAAADWSYTEYELLGENGLEIPLHSGRAPAISGNIVRALLQQETGVCPCTLLVRRSLFDAIGGFCEDPRMAYRDDAEFALRLARASEAIALPERLTLVREHDGRLTKTLNAPHEHSAFVYEFFLKVETSGELRRLARRRRAECLCAAGAQSLERGEYGKAAALFCRSLASGGPGCAYARAAARGIRARLRSGDSHKSV